MESFIGLPVPAAVEPVPVGLSAGGGNGGHAADRSETCLARDALRVVARGDREFRGVDGAAPLHLQEGWRIGLDEPMHGALQLACFLIELQPGPGERPQGRKQRPGDVVFRIRAARPQFPVQARSLERPVFGPDPLRGRHQEGAYGVGYAGHGVDVYGSRHRKGAQALNPLVVYYERRKNYYKNQGRKREEIVTLSFLAQCMMSILLGRPDQARARPSTLLSDEVQYKKIFGQDGNLEAYYRAASLGKQVCLKFPQIKRDLEGSQISDIRFYVIMGVASMLSNKDSLTFGDIENLDLDKLSDEIIQTVADMVMDVYLALGGTSKAAKSYAMASKVKEKISLLLP